MISKGGARHGRLNDITHTTGDLGVILVAFLIMALMFGVGCLVLHILISMFS